MAQTVVLAEEVAAQELVEHPALLEVVVYKPKLVFVAALVMAAADPVATCVVIALARVGHPVVET